MILIVISWKNFFQNIFPLSNLARDFVDTFQIYQILASQTMDETFVSTFFFRHFFVSFLRLKQRRKGVQQWRTKEEKGRGKWKERTKERKSRDCNFRERSMFRNKDLPYANSLVVLHTCKCTFSLLQLLKYFFPNNRILHCFNELLISNSSYCLI